MRKIRNKTRKRVIFKMNSFPELRTLIFPLMRAEIILGKNMIWLFAAVYASGHGSNKIERHGQGLKMAASMPRWGQLWTRYKENKNPTATSEELGTKAGCYEQKHGPAQCPLHSTHLGGYHLSHPTSGPRDTHLPSPHLRNQFAPPWGVSKGTCYLFSLPPCGPRSFNQALPEFLDWSLAN